MSVQTYDDRAPSGLIAQFGRAAAAVFDGLIRMAEANPQFQKLERLQGLSDAELAERGLKREDLVYMVFGARGWI